ncbi:MAG: lipoyl synthase [Deltaproteobacteria bacterium]|nr:lipoyl synthase [Deltaproteobacteria bacterium]
MTNQRHQPEGPIRKPGWLGRPLPSDPAFSRIRFLLEEGHLHTVCQEARCPNQGECFSRGTAVFLILGNSCTRRCRFCAVTQGAPEKPDPDEPRRVAEAAARMSLDYIVVTSVTRDDLADGGAGFFAETIRCLRARSPRARVEVLIPDFQGDEAALRTVLDARPDVLNHNLETVARLYQEVRPQAVYARSLELLRRTAAWVPGVAVKSGLMLGLGERAEEVESTLHDLLDAGCQILTLGQYLQPKKECLPVVRYIPPVEFDQWREAALDIGFAQVASGPLVRSSYHAEELFRPRWE